MAKQLSEIKFGQTINNDYFKRPDFRRKPAGEPVGQAWLVYGVTIDSCAPMPLVCRGIKSALSKLS